MKPPHRQSRRMSMVEAAANVVIGYALAVLTQILIFPVVGLTVTFSQNLQIGLLFTGISLLRSYLLRRFFNRIAL